MPFCAACGKEIMGWNFCPYCGRPTGFYSVQPNTELQSTVPSGHPSAQQFLSPTPPPAGTPYSSPPTGAAASNVSRAPARRVLIFAIVGAASMSVAILASFLPWISYSGITIGGLHRDGILVLALGLLGVIFTFAAAILKSRRPFVVLIALGVAISVVTLTDIVNVTRTSSLSLSNVGVGLLIGAAAGVIAIVSGAAGSSLFSLPLKVETPRWT